LKLILEVYETLI